MKIKMSIRSWKNTANKENRKEWEQIGDDIGGTHPPIKVSFWTRNNKTFFVEVMRENPYHGVPGYDDEEEDEEYDIDITSVFKNRNTALQKVKYYLKKYRNR